VLYVLLPAHPDVNYFIFFGSYLLAQIAGIISNVPGGLGVFETVLLLLISPPIAADQLLGALLVYRVVYYFLPLLVERDCWVFMNWDNKILMAKSLTSKINS
jgi:uncharacterized membrane protein YbhN (UPF0104 family)